MLIAPSILAADFSNLGAALAAIGDADEVHLDVMDGHFVPNLTFGPPLIASLRKHTELPFDAHLMVTNAETCFQDYIRAGVTRLTFHVEAVSHLDSLIHATKSAGIEVGIALNPTTPLAVLEQVLPMLDLVLLMSVNPGFGGQKFIPYVMDKIARLRRIIDDLDAATRPRISVDGGVTAANIAEISRAGADMVVAGSAVFGAPEGCSHAIRHLKQLCAA